MSWYEMGRHARFLERKSLYTQFVIDLVHHLLLLVEGVRTVSLVLA